MSLTSSIEPSSSAAGSVNVGVAGHHPGSPMDCLDEYPLSGEEQDSLYRARIEDGRSPRTRTVTGCSRKPVVVCMTTTPPGFRRVVPAPSARDTSAVAVRNYIQWTRCQRRTISVGTIISLRVAGTDIACTKNGPGQNYGPLFQGNDRTHLRSEQFAYDGVDPNDPELAREELAFARRLSGLVPRLELLGFTLEQVEAEYSQAVQEHEEQAEALDQESEGRSPRLMTFPEFCAFVSNHPIGELDGTFVGGMDGDAKRRREGRFFGEALEQRIPPWLGLRIELFGA